MGPSIDPVRVRFWTMPYIIILVELARPRRHVYIYMYYILYVPQTCIREILYPDSKGSIAALEAVTKE